MGSMTPRRHLGGTLPSPALQEAVRRAIKTGTIVLAAAGNQVRFVVFPAAFDEVIAVAASTEGLLPLSQHSARLVGEVTYHDYEGIALAMDERERGLISRVA